MAHDELGAHMRDELGITEVAHGPAVPGGGDVGGRRSPRARSCPCSPCSRRSTIRIPAIVVVTLLALVGARRDGAALGGASRGRGALRTLVLSSAALLVSWLVGQLVGAVV